MQGHKASSPFLVAPDTAGMTSGKTIMRGAALSTLGMLVSMAGALAAAKIYTNTPAIDKADLGVFFLMIVACDLLTLVSNFGLNTSLPKIAAEMDGTRRAPTAAGILAGQTLISLAFGLATLVFWIALRDPAVISTNPNWLGLYAYLWLLPAFFILATLRDTALAALAGLNRYGPRASALIVSGVGNAGFVALLLWGMKGDLGALMAATLLTYALALAWLIWSLPCRRLKPDWSAYAGAVAFSVPLYLNNLMGFVFQRLDTVLVAFFLGAPGAVATFEIAKRVPPLLQRVLSATLVPYLPSLSGRLAQGDRDGAARLANETLALTILLGYAGTLALVAVQDRLILLLFSPEYLDATEALWFLLLGVCVSLQAGLLGQTLIAYDQPKWITISNIVAALVSLALNCIFIPRYGIMGAGLAYVITVSVSAALQAFFLRRVAACLNGARWIAPQLYMAAALALALNAETAAWRLGACVGFVLLCLATRVVQARKLIEWFRMLRQEP